jgi:hypothetical protein
VESPKGPDGPVTMQGTEGVCEEEIIPLRLIPNEKNSVHGVKLGRINTIKSLETVRDNLVSRTHIR